MLFGREATVARIYRPNDPRRSANLWRRIASLVNWQVVLGFVILLGFFVFTLWQDTPNWRIPGTVGLVLVGWVFSVCVHEFAHAAVAYVGGDRSDSTESYLTFNPLRYVNSLLSIALPLLYLLIGGVPLPGGAVYLHKELVRNRVWRSAVSLAGPVASALVGLVAAIPFLIGDPYTPHSFAQAHATLAGALALLIFFEAVSVALNLLPIPPLDGYGVIEPWLPPTTQATVRSFGFYPSLLLVVVIFYVAPVANALFQPAYSALDALHVNVYLFALGSGTVELGYSNFFFWRR